MNLKYMKVSLFEITYKKKKELFHDILIHWDAPVIHLFLFTGCHLSLIMFKFYIYVYFWLVIFAVVLKLK